MIAYGAAHNPSQLKLYWGNGTNSVLGGTNIINWSQANNNGVQNLLIWAYGGKVDYINVGFQAFQQNNSTSAAINTVSAGATALVVNDGNEGLFSSGDMIALTADCLDFATGGYPPTFQFHQIARVTSRSSTTVNIDVSTIAGYKSTYPVCALGGSMGSGGPARIFKLDPSYDSNVEIRGLTLLNPGASQWNINSRVATLYDVTFLNSSIGPSANQNFTSFNGNFPVGAEIDKDADTMTISGGTIGQIAVQSASPTTLNLLNLAISCSVNGTAINTTIRNSTVTAGSCDGRIAPGPTGYGGAQSLVVDTVTFPVATADACEVETANVSFSSGVFSMLKSKSNAIKDTFFRCFVPGFKYKFAWHNAVTSNCTPLAEFTVSDISEDGSNYNATISNCSWGSCSGALPTPSCSGSPTTYSLYNSLAITQTNMGGSPSLLGFAAP